MTATRRKGLPKELEDELMGALVPILKKYKDMKKSHMSRDRIAGSLICRGIGLPVLGMVCLVWL